MMTFRPGQRLYIPGVQVLTPRQASAAFTGVLDGISNVAAAYSLRKLRSAYAGSAVRVRRSSDSTEQDIGFASDGEFDSAAFSAFVGGGTGFVKTWYDQSGNARDATQATTANQPRLVLSAVNSMPGLDFDGANDVMESATFTGLAMPNTALIAHKADIGGAHGFLSTTGNEHAMWAGGATYQVYGGGTGANPSPLVVPSGNAEIITPVWSTTNTKFYINGGTDRTTNNVNSATLNSVRLGFYTYYLNGYLLEVVVLNASISSADHNTIGTNMATRFGLSWTTVT